MSKPISDLRGSQMAFIVSQVNHNWGFLQVLEKSFGLNGFLVISRLVWEDVAGM